MSSTITNSSWSENDGQWTVTVDRTIEGKKSPRKSAGRSLTTPQLTGTKGLSILNTLYSPLDIPVDHIFQPKLQVFKTSKAIVSNTHLSLSSPNKKAMANARSS